MAGVRGAVGVAAQAAELLFRSAAAAACASETVALRCHG